MGSEEDSAWDCPSGGRSPVPHWGWDEAAAEPEGPSRAVQGAVRPQRRPGLPPPGPVLAVTASAGRGSRADRVTEPSSSTPPGESLGVREAGGAGSGPHSWLLRGKLAQSPEAWLAGGPGYHPRPVPLKPGAGGGAVQR